MKPRFDERYLVVGSAFLIQGVVIGSLFAYGVFFKVLEVELGWSRTLLSACFSASFVVMGLLAIPGGRLSDRFGPRWVLTASGISFGLGYALMYFLSAPWHLFLFYGVLIGAGLSTHDVVLLSTVARWFDKRRGLMTGVVKVGTAFGQMTIPLLSATLITSLGWRTASVVLGLGAMVLLVTAAQGVRRRPVAATENGVAPPEAGLAFAAALRTRQFWILCAAQFAFLPSLVTIPVHIAPHGMDLGLSATAAAALLSVIGGCSIAGRLFVGTAVDRIGGRYAMLVCFAILAATLLFLRAVETGTGLVLFAVFYGFAHGGFFTVVSPTVAEYFGTAAHGTIFGAILFCGTIGGALGPLLAGHLFDTTGSYDVAFLTLAILAAAGFVLVSILRPVAASASAAPSTIS